MLGEFDAGGIQCRGIRFLGEFDARGIRCYGNSLPGGIKFWGNSMRGNSIPGNRMLQPNSSIFYVKTAVCNMMIDFEKVWLIFIHVTHVKKRVKFWGESRTNYGFIFVSFLVSSPKVKGMAEYLSVAQGGKIKLKCKVAGSPRPKVTWLKDGRPIANTIRISIKSKR